MPRDPIIPTWEELKNYELPDPTSDKKYNEIDNFKNDNQDRYQIASMGISGFNTYIFLRGFQNALMDFVIEDKKGEELLNKISKLLKGKQCFLVPISYQTVSIKGTPKDIKREARRLFNKIGTKNGGLIAWIEEYSSIGMPEKNYYACANAFTEIKMGNTSVRPSPPKTSPG